MSLQVQYKDVPAGAREAASFASDTGQEFSQTQRLGEGVADIPWVTLEPKNWSLDGTGQLLPDNPDQIGWWSRELSSAAGVLLYPPTITVTFPQQYTAAGLTFRFSPSTNQWCRKMEVAWYRGNLLLDRVSAQPTAADWVLTYGVADFDKVVIRFEETNTPRQFVKLQQLQIGRVMLFMGDELVKVRLLNEIDPSLNTLPVDTMTVEIRDGKDRDLQLEKGQQVRLYRDGIQLATHYVTDAQRQSRQNYRLHCQSAVGLLEDSFLGGIYEEFPVEQLLQAVLDGLPFSLDPAFSGETITGYLPVCTRRQALQQIVFALGAVVTTQGDGNIRLRLPEESVSNFFDTDRIFSSASLKRTSPVAAVELLTHSYIPDGERKTLLNETAVFGENVLFVFSEPYYDYQIAGGSLLDSDANWVRITADGPVFLTAKKYSHTVEVHRKENALLTTMKRGNVVTVDKATLMHADNADQALQRLYDYYTMVDLLTQDVVVTGEVVGQLSESITPWNTPIVGYITEMESEFTQFGHRANIQIRGREVQV